MPFHSSGVDQNIKVIAATELLRDRNAFRNERPIWVNGTVTEISGPIVALDGPNGLRCNYVSNSEQARLRIGRKVKSKGSCTRPKIQ